MTINEIRCQRCDKLMSKSIDPKYSNLILFTDASQLCEQCIKEKFKYCTECGAKISWFRKWKAKKMEKNLSYKIPLRPYMMPLRQFCSDKCAGERLDRMLQESQI
jgi:hypothetical protein